MEKANGVSGLTRNVSQIAEFCQQARKLPSLNWADSYPSTETKALVEVGLRTKVTSEFGEASANIVTTASSVTSS
jgi:hypothetical protein